MFGVRFGVLSWKTGCLVSRCSGEPVFPAPSLLPTAPGCCVYSLSFLFLNFLSWDGGWGFKLSGTCAHRQARIGASLAPRRVWIENRATKDWSRFLPVLCHRSYFFLLLPSYAPLSSLCLRCTTSDEVVNLTRAHVVADAGIHARTGETNRSDDFGEERGQKSP